MKVCAIMMNVVFAMGLMVQPLGLALAQSGESPQQACRKDAEKYCAAVQPGGGRMGECLKKHEAHLSAQCKVQMGTIVQCSKEVAKICGSEASTPQALSWCFLKNSNEFSPGCRQAAAAESSRFQP